VGSSVSISCRESAWHTYNLTGVKNILATLKNQEIGSGVQNVLYHT